MPFAVFYKEAIKTRFIMLFLFLFNLCYMIWTFVSIRRLFILDHSEVVWYRVMNLGQIPYSNLMYVPLITALLFCVFQFLQEMRDARIRISLHLPSSSSSLVLFHAFFGLVFLCLLFAFDMLIIHGIISHYFPSEVSTSAFITMLPWYVAGLVSYLGGAFVLLEPIMKRKVLAVVITFLFCLELLFYHTTAYYSHSIFVYLAFLPCLLFALPLAGYDYRNRGV